MRYNSQRKRRRSRWKVLVISCVLLAIYAGVLLMVQMIGSRLETKDIPEPVGSLEGRFSTEELTYQYMNRTWTYRKNALTNILLIGVDWADAQRNPSARFDGQADFLYLVSIDKRNKTVLTVHIDRDTVTPIRIYGPFGDYAGLRDTQINLSYAYGDSDQENCDNTVWAVSHLLGNIPIKGYIVMDMGGIEAVNDALGGITVLLEDDFTHQDPSMAVGATVTLKGKQAEYYVRGRVGIGSGTNLSRMSRQRVFIDAVNERLVQGMKKDMNYIGRFYDDIQEHLITNLSRGWLINIAYESQDYARMGTHNLYGTHQIGEDGFIGFYPDQDSLGDLLTNYYFE